MSSPVYLKASPRSGGTLLVTMLDAHPQIAMSYEIYEEHLRENSEVPRLDDLVRDIEKSLKKSKDDIQTIKGLANADLRVFLFRARRGGLTLEDIIEDLKCIAENNYSFSRLASRLDFIDKLMQRKMLKTDKRIWGGKTHTDLYELHDRYPDALFLITIRDIRDIYASMLTKGSFSYTAEEAALHWKHHIESFRKFVIDRNPRAMEINYEQLVHEPVPILYELCDLIGVDYSYDMLSYHEKDMSLFKNSHGHLSSEQLKAGLNHNSIGRWRNDLADSDIDSILAVAGDMLHE